MPAPTTALVKTWCRIDGTEFDTVLPTMINAATALAGNEIGVDYTTQTMPEPVQQWVAAHVAYWLDNPRAAAEKALSPSPFLGGLLDPYRTQPWTQTLIGA